MNSILYRVIRRGQPGGRTPGVAGGGEQKYYAFIKREREMTLREIVNDIASRSTLTTGDAMNAIENFLELVPKYLRRGHPVNLGDFGIFRMNLSSKGHESADQVTRYSVKGARVVFTPALEMKRNLAMLSYAKADDSRVYDEGEEGTEAAA